MDRAIDRVPALAPDPGEIGEPARFRARAISSVSLERSSPPRLRQGQGLVVPAQVYPEGPGGLAQPARNVLKSAPPMAQSLLKSTTAL